MEYKELRNILCAAAAEHKTIEAFVTFTQDSFPGTEYTLPERTYQFTSKEKAFSASNSGYSIFGNCMDGIVFNEAYKRGHHAGHEEVASYAHGCGLFVEQVLEAMEVH